MQNKGLGVYWWTKALIATSHTIVLTSNPREPDDHIAERIGQNPRVEDK
jgi:hypothetical protein